MHTKRRKGVHAKTGGQGQSFHRKGQLFHPVHERDAAATERGSSITYLMYTPTHRYRHGQTGAGLPPKGAALPPTSGGRASTERGSPSTQCMRGMRLPPKGAAASPTSCTRHASTHYTRGGSLSKTTKLPPPLGARFHLKRGTSPPGGSLEEAPSILGGGCLH